MPFPSYCNGAGAAGLRAIKEQGGVALVQNPEEAEKPTMPYTAMMTAHPDACLSVEELAKRVAALCSAQSAARPTIS
jgi:chemotaxis response regulator CheB